VTPGARDGMKRTTSSVATAERSRVSDPANRDTLLLQGEEYNESGQGDGTGERGGSDAEREQAVRKLGSKWKNGAH